MSVLVEQARALRGRRERQVAERAEIGAETERLVRELARAEVSPSESARELGVSREYVHRVLRREQA